MFTNKIILKSHVLYDIGTRVIQKENDKSTKRKRNYYKRYYIQTTTYVDILFINYNIFYEKHNKIIICEQLVRISEYKFDSFINFIH